MTETVMQRAVTRERITCRMTTIDRLTADDVEQWRTLAWQALEKNPYLCPEFVLPALRLRTAFRPIHVLMATVDEPKGGGLCAIGFFRAHGPDPDFPLPHLRAYRSRHSFLTGLLLREDVARGAGHAMMEHLVFGNHRWFGAQFALHRLDGPQATLIRQICLDRGIVWYETRRSSRATLDLAPERRWAWQGHVSRQRQDSIRRARRGLAKAGTVTWRYLAGQDVGREQVDTFLNLEHRSWKSGAQSSLRSSPKDESFFREMVENFRRRDGVFFTELMLDDRVIASTCNLRVGSEGFAFKVAYDPEYRRMSPGVVNEYQFLEALDRIPDLRTLDSGASEGSFIEKLWPGRIQLGTGYFIGKRSARLVATVMTGLRRAGGAIWRRGAAPISPPGKR